MLIDKMKNLMMDLLLVCPILLFFCFSNFSFSSELRLVTLQYPPYSYEEEGVIKGIAVDTVIEVFKRIEQPIKITIYPWARAINYIKIGKADAIFTVYKTSEREKFANFSTEVLFTQTSSLYVTEDSDIKFSGRLEELSNYMVGAVRAVNYGPMFENAVNQNFLPKLDLTNSGEINIKKLLASRVDIIVSNQLGAQYILEAMLSRNKVKALMPCLEKIPSYIAYSSRKNLDNIRERFDSELKKFKESLEYAKILKKYGIPSQVSQDCSN